MKGPPRSGRPLRICLPCAKNAGFAKKSTAKNLDKPPVQSIN